MHDRNARTIDSPESLRLFLRTLVFLIAAAVACQSQETAQSTQILVHADRPDGSLSPVWAFFGYDEPNYTYAQNGKKLLREIAALSPVPVYIRVHNLLTTGDGSASLKWGSTNAYTEDADGRPVYSWTIIDHIFDTFHQAGIKPLVEIGFMPEALSTHPEPYRHDFPRGSIYTGWAYPPKDYQKWSELVFQLAHHLRQRYGDDELRSWLWEVWNEPDIGYWQGTANEYFQLYDFTTDAVLRAFPAARIGGPDSTGPGNSKAAEFLRSFLDHCAHGKNNVSGKTGAPLDFISFHPKGSPKWQGDHVEMGISRQLAAIEQGFEIVASFAEYRTTPIILGESDPEGCAACSAKQNPQNSYRNGPLYAAYTAEELALSRALAEREHVNLLGSVTWAFEFEDQLPFEGFRELATNGIDKPVLNGFRMFGLLGSERVQASSSAALPVDEVVTAGVRAQPDIRVVATRRGTEIEVLVWNYHDDDLPAAAARVELTLDGLSPDARRLLIDHFRIDSDHSNAFTVWKEIGSPSSLSTVQLDQLDSAGQLQLLSSPEWVSISNRALRLSFALPRQGLSLLRIGW